MSASQPATITGFHGSLLVLFRLLFMLGLGVYFICQARLREYVQVLCRCFDIRRCGNVFITLRVVKCAFD